jgi:amidase
MDRYLIETQFVLALDVGFKYFGPQYFKELKFNPTGITSLQQLLYWIIQFPAEQYPPRNVDLWQARLDSNLTVDSPEYLQAIAHNANLGSNATILGALDNCDLERSRPSDRIQRSPDVYAGHLVITVPLGYFNATDEGCQSRFWSSQHNRARDSVRDVFHRQTLRRGEDNPVRVCV